MTQDLKLIATQIMTEHHSCLDNLIFLSFSHDTGYRLNLSVMNTWALHNQR